MTLNAVVNKFSAESDHANAARGYTGRARSFWIASIFEGWARASYNLYIRVFGTLHCVHKSPRRLSGQKRRLPSTQTSYTTSATLLTVVADEETVAHLWSAFPNAVLYRMVRRFMNCLVISSERSESRAGRKMCTRTTSRRCGRRRTARPRTRRPGRPPRASPRGSSASCDVDCSLHNLLLAR